MTTTRSPGRWLYLLAAGLFIGGIVVFGVVLTSAGKKASGAGSGFSKLMSMGTTMDRFVVPGHVDTTVASPGRQVIYYEHRSLVGGTPYTTSSSAPAVGCTVTNITTGAVVPTKKVSFPETYSFPDHEAFALFEFEALAAGAYRVEAHPTNPSAPPFVLAVGPGIVNSDFISMVKGTCLGSLVCLLTSVAALVILIVTLVKRSRSAKRINAPQAIPAGMPPPQQY